MTSERRNKSDSTSPSNGEVADLQPRRHCVPKAIDICQQLLLTLQTAQIVHDTSHTRDQASQTDEPHDSSSFDDRNKLHVENSRLTQKLKELVEMNVQWQKMFSEQQRSLTELKTQQQNQQQQQQQQSERVETPAAMSPVDQRPIHSPRYSELEDDTKCTKLESQLQQAQRLVEQLETTVTSLREGLDTATKDREATVEMLRVQVLVYREDFEAERQDRERAQSQLAELQTQLTLLQNNIAHHRTRQSAYVTGPTMIHYNSASRVLQHRGLRAADRWETDGVDEVDCGQPSVVPAASRSDKAATAVDAGGATNSSSEVLHCPRCLHEFSIDQHLELMDHIDLCEANTD